MGDRSRLGLHEAFKGFQQQRKLLAALATNLQVLLDEVIGFFDWPPLEGQLGEAAQFPQALVAGQLSIPRAADGLQKGADLVEPDPKGQIHRDEQRLIEAEVVVVPARVRPGEAARVHLTFRPSAARAGHWNNESAPLRVWIAGAEGWTISTRLLEAPQAAQPESVEVRRLDFEVKAPPTATGKTRLAAYALYNTCEQTGGRCLFVRQDLVIELQAAR